MANRWGIPKEVENIVIERDKKCVYCGVEFSTSENNRKARQSWEHIINDIKLNSVDNIALCCVSCNASKGSKDLKEWLNSNYCLKKGITEKSVSTVVKKYFNSQ
jgi:5-methylcytosine-specific restriction endonuclease McrA